MSTALRTSSVAAALILSAFVAFGPALDAPFDFDDLPAIVNNQSIRQLRPVLVALNPPGLGTAVSGRPVANLSFALNYAAAGSLTDTRSYHVVNILLHVATALLVFATVRLTVRLQPVANEWRDAAERIALVTATIWLVHPIQTEAVNYVSQRTELLVSFFYMTTLYCAIRAWEASTSTGEARARARWWYALSIVASAFGMGSKEVMVTAPIAVILYDRAFLFDGWRAAWASRPRRRFYVALIATTGISVALIARGGRAATVGFGLGTAWYEYLYSQCWAIAHYLRLVVWPDGLTYDYGQNPIRGLVGIPGAIGLTVLGIATLGAWRRSNLRWLAFLGSWFFLLLAPSSSIVPIRTEIAAERRIYLAVAAVFVLVGVALEWIRRTHSRRIALASYAGAAFLCTAMVGASFARSRLYQTPALLWQDAMIKQPNNARALNGVAVAAMKRDPTRLSEPDSLLARALVLDSTFVQAWQNRAVIAIHTNRLPNAETFLRHALEVEPGDSAATDLLGTVLVARGRSAEAVPYLRQVASKFPNAKSLTALGTAYLTSAQFDSAIAAFRRAIELDSSYTDALTYLGAAFVESNRGSEAIPYLLRSVNHDSRSGFSFALLCLAYGQSHQAGLAEEAGASAVAREPTNAVVYLFAGRGLQAAGRLADAARYLTESVRLNPLDPHALTRLGMVEASLGRLAAGKQHIQRALAIAPHYYLAEEAEKMFAALR